MADDPKEPALPVEGPHPDPAEVLDGYRKARRIAATPPPSGE